MDNDNLSSHGWFVEALNGVDNHCHPCGDCTSIQKKKNESIPLNVFKGTRQGVQLQCTLRDSHKEHALQALNCEI